MENSFNSSIMTRTEQIKKTIFGNDCSDSIEIHSLSKKKEFFEKNGSKLSDDDCYFLKNVMTDIEEYLQLLRENSSKKIVFLFPPVNNFRRFLIHHLIKEFFEDKNLCTLSVGSSYARRTAVFPLKFKLMDSVNIFSNDEGQNKNITKKTRMLAHSSCRPTSMRNANNVTDSFSNNKSKKNRKPDQQIYVPRARRFKNLENADLAKNLSLTDCSENSINDDVSDSPDYSFFESKHEIKDTYPVTSDKKIKYNKNNINSEDDCITFEVSTTVSPKSSEYGDTMSENNNGSYKEIINTTASAEEKFWVNEKNVPTISEDDFIRFVLPTDNALENKPEFSSKRLNSCNVHETTDFVKNSEDLLNNKSKSKNLNVNDCDWEELFDDDGECVDKCLIAELMSAVGKVKIEHASQDYRSFQTLEERSNNGECIVEVYDFPPEFTTHDLNTVFASFRSNNPFQITWVDDTHALLAFSNPLSADEVLNTELPNVKTRPLRNAILKSKIKANSIIVQPNSRPVTCASLARRLVSGHLGMKIHVTDKQREVERKLLSEAREKKRLVAKQKSEIWEGNLSRKE